MTVIHLREFLGGARRDDLPTPVAALRPEIEDQVGALDHFEVVLDDHQGVPRVGESLKHVEQLPDVVEVKAGGRFVENVEGVSGGPAAEFARQLHPLGLAAGERRARLSELHVVEPDVADAGEHPVDPRVRLEELHRVLDGQIEHVGDVLPAVADFEGLPVVSPAPTRLAFHEDVGEEVHLDAAHALALAFLAAAALDVEAEPTGLVAADLRLVGHAEQLPDLVEDPGVGRGVRTRGPTDRRLVHVDHPVDPLKSVDPGVRAGDDLGAGDGPHRGLEQDLVDEGALAASGHAGDAHDPVQREGRVDRLQVVRRGALHHDRVPDIE